MPCRKTDTDKTVTKVGENNGLYKHQQDTVFFHKNAISSQQLMGVKSIKKKMQSHLDEKVLNKRFRAIGISLAGGGEPRTIWGYNKA